MGITSYREIILAMILCGSIIQTLSSSLPPYDAMQCFFHSKSDEPDSCLLGGKHTACGTYKCFLTIGETCTTGHEAKLKGTECAKSLVCGCDKKCNGCMTVNGEQRCHWALNCMPFGKRNQLKVFPEEIRDRSIDYPIDDALAV